MTQYPRRTRRWTAYCMFFNTGDVEEIDVFSERRPSDETIKAAARRAGYDPDEFDIVEVRR